MSNLPYKVRIDRINIAWALFLLSMPKKVKEALRTRLRNKISWTEISVRLKKIAKWKTILDRETLVCYENSPVYPTLKKRAIFFVCNRNPPSPKISFFRSLHRLSSNNSEITNHRHLPLTGTDHCNSRLSENIHFYRSNQSSQNYNFFSKSKILFIWNLGTFNTHHFFMRKHFMYVDCYTLSWVSPLLFYTREQWDKYWLSVKLKWGRANVCQKFKDVKGRLVVISIYWR